MFLKRSLLLLVSLLLTAGFVSGRLDPVAAESAVSAELLQSLQARFTGGPHPPIVLVHGWQGANIGLECRRHAPEYVDDNWGLMDEELEALGFPVFMARLYSGGATGAAGPADPNYHCTPVAEENVDNLIEAIDEALATSGQPRVILIAHSMGGLVSRAYLENPAVYRGDVAALYTLGSPHVGVPVGVLAAWVQALTFGSITLDTYCVAQPVVCQFADNEADLPVGFSGIQTFNAVHHTRAPGVYYHLLGGDINYSDRSLLCDPLYLLIPGKNDCIVPLPSALGMGSADGSLGPLGGLIDRLEVYAAHIETFADTPTFTCGYTHTFHDKNYVCYRTIRQRLASGSLTDCLAPSLDNRSSAHTCGSVQSLSGREPGPATTPGTAREIGRHVGALLPETTTRRSLDHPGGLLVAALLLDSADYHATLLTPTGALVHLDKRNPIPGVIVKQAPEGISVTVPNAAPGAWQIEITAGKQPVRWTLLAAADPDPAAAVAFFGGEGMPEQTISAEQPPLAPRPLAEPVHAPHPTADHSCTVNAPSPVRAGDGVAIASTLTLVGNDQSATWIDHYFIDTAQSLLPVGQSAAPADAGGWGRSTSATLCPAQGMGYWGLATPWGIPGGLCNLSTTNLPLFGSFNGPWKANSNPNTTAFGPESFEGVTFPPAGWQMIQVENPGNGSQGWRSTTAQARTGSRSAWHNDDSACWWCTGDFDSWLIMPRRLIRAGDRLVWWQRLEGSQSGLAGAYEIHISPGSSSPGSDHYRRLTGLDQATIGSWTGWYIDLSEYTSKEVWIAFRYYADGDHELYLDDVEIRREQTAATTYNFALTAEIPATTPLCPGADHVGISAVDNPYGFEAVAIGDRLPVVADVAACGLPAQTCPVPAAALTLTVSIDAICPGTAAVTIPVGQPVTLCYVLTNTSADVTLSGYTHTPPDFVPLPEGGSPSTILAELAPGQSVAWSESVNLTGEPGTTWTGNATARASTAQGHGQPQGQGSNVPYVTTAYETDAQSAPVIVHLVGIPTAIPVRDIATGAGDGPAVVVLILAILAGPALYAWRRRGTG